MLHRVRITKLFTGGLLVGMTLTEIVSGCSDETIAGFRAKVGTEVSGFGSPYRLDAVEVIA